MNNSVDFWVCFKINLHIVVIFLLKILPPPPVMSRGQRTLCLANGRGSQLGVK